MTNCKSLLPLAFLAIFSASCSTSKEAYDSAVVEHSIENKEIIRELAEFAIAFTKEKPKKVFSTDSLSNREIKKKFNKNGYGGLITVTYKNSNNNKIFGLIDSTVFFKQTSLNGVTELIYDFATKERKFEDERTNQYVFLTVSKRIYYRRRPVPMM